MANKKIEYGMENQNDHTLYRKVTFRQKYIDYDGTVSRKEGTIKKYRNRIIDLSIPEGQTGRVTYSAWKDAE
ncbi:MULTISPECIES: hypothetical protein [Lactobacillus]|uniref:Uncharacterized protein n=1 Tax=Lactobacillus xujianguonis TaxID=2495899 RepID=A0A437SX85_9LACO|nr:MULTISPECIES: hypothetical protein [Lactobacillus]RVU71548.1 hypothetical protein EJK17_02280 [Lactobacillus xujianguonis]RVU76735.1 hypothetical protein EJK20_04440 [Lactobacillus xujianguonis]